MAERRGFDRKPYLYPVAEITPHYLRHNYATLLYRAGVPVLQAKEWLGHTDIKVTLNIYTELSKLDNARNAVLLDKVF